MGETNKTHQASSAVSTLNVAEWPCDQSEGNQISICKQGDVSAVIQKAQELQTVSHQKLLFQGNNLLCVCMEMLAERLLLLCNENLSLKAAMKGNELELCTGV